MTIYVLAHMIEHPMLQKYQILGSVSQGDWYTSEIAALACMDQYNGDILERLDDEEYHAGNFNLYGTFKFDFGGLV